MERESLLRNQNKLQKLWKKKQNNINCKVLIMKVICNKILLNKIIMKLINKKCKLIYNNKKFQNMKRY